MFIFMLPALLFALFLVKVMIEHTPMDFSVAMPAMVVTGGLTFAGFIYTIRQSPKLRYLALGGLTLFVSLTSLGLYLYFTHLQTQLLTCQVCGYKSLSEAGDECPVCFIPLTATFQAENGYESQEDLIKAEQIMFFMPVGREEIDFYQPDPSPEGFAKDKDWKPVTTAAEILEIQQMLPDSLQ